MTRAFVLRAFIRTSAWVGVIALGSVMALGQDAASANASRSDGQIEMDVVHALDASQALKNDLITAATIQSEVTLSGTVASDSSRQLAESIAKTVPGVTAVHNNLKIGNPADDANSQGAPPNDPANDMGDAQPAQNSQTPSDGQSPSYGQNGGEAAGGDQNPAQGQQGAPSINQAPPPDWGGQNQHRPEYGRDYPQQPPPYGQGYPQQQGQGGYPQQSPYGQPPVYGQAPPAQPGYGQAPPPVYGQGPVYGQAPPQFEIPRGPVTIPPGTLLQVRTNSAVDNKHAQGGEPIQFTVIQDVALDGMLAIPRGATLNGVIAEVKHPNPGALTGSNELALQLTSLELMGRSYPLQSELFKVKGPGKGGRSAGNVIGGALIGAIIGGAVGGGTGAAVGAVAGGGTGAAVSGATSGPGVWIPAEALVSFRLTVPVTVQPVTPQEAMRLAQGLYPGGPRLYARPAYGYPYRPYPSNYAPVYYRPYYTAGGYYYWR